MLLDRLGATNESQEEFEDTGNENVLNTFSRSLFKSDSAQGSISNVRIGSTLGEALREGARRGTSRVGRGRTKEREQ